jgi:lipopolysaccharide export system permease protein
MKEAEEAASGQARHGKNVLLKYLIAELMLYFVIAFLFFFLIFFVNQILLVAENILKMRVPFKNVALLIVYSMPFIVAQSAPFATLVGFLVCLGRLVTENEVLIFRASGHSYSLLLAPVLLLGLFISMVSFIVNDYLLPLATVAYSDLYRRIAVSNPGVELEPHSVKRTNESTLVIGDVSGKTVSDLVFFDVDTNNSWRVIVAGNTLVTQAQDKSVLMQLEMRDAVVALFDTADKTTYDVIMSGEVHMNIFNSTIFPPLPVPNPREMPARTLWGRILELRQMEDISPQQINIYELEFHKKFSLPFASVFFALMALPFAILFGSHNGQTIGFVFGIVVCVMYWAMMILGQLFSGNNGFNGALSMWIPNALVGGVGLVCFIGLRRK